MGTKVYIAGKISGLEPVQFHRKFERCRGYVIQHMPYDTEVLIPTELCQDDWSWEQCMKVCRPAVQRCDLLVVMPDWMESKGAKEEVEIAKENNIPIWFLDDEKY